MKARWPITHVGERLVRVAVATANEAGEVKVVGVAYLSLP